MSKKESSGTIEIPLTPAGLPNYVFNDELIKKEEAGDKLAAALSAMVEIRLC